MFKLHHGLYGYWRLHDCLLDEGYSLSQERVRRRMSHLNLKTKQRKKYKQTTDSNHSKPVANNILARYFTVNKINQAWVCDITYIKFEKKWLYLAIVLDLCSRKIIGWAMDTRMESTLVCQALTMAMFHRGYPSKVIVHSCSAFEKIGACSRLKMGLHIKDLILFQSHRMVFLVLNYPFLYMCHVALDYIKPSVA